MRVAIDGDPDVVAIVPTLGRRPERLAECLGAIERQNSELRLAIVVLVNGADELAPIPGATVVTAGLNLGWAGGLRFARTLVDAPYLWLVQDDMVVDPDCLAELSAALLVDSELAVVAPVVLDDDGNVPARSCGAVLDVDGDIEQWIPAAAQPPDRLTELSELGFVPSRGMLVRTADWDRVGGMDPRLYPVGWADVDFCTALTLAGRGFALVPSARTRHGWNGSTGRPYGEFLFYRNRSAYLAKRAGERRSTVNPAIPDELLADIAIAASGTLGALADDYARAVLLLEAAGHELDRFRSAPAARLPRFLSGRSGARRRSGPASTSSLES